MTLSFGSTVQSLGLPTPIHCHFARGRGSTAGGGGGCSTACKSEETWSSHHLCQVMHAREVDRPLNYCREIAKEDCAKQKPN